MAQKGRPISRPMNPDNVTSLYDLARGLKCSYDQAVRLRKDGLTAEPDGTFSLAKAAWFLKQRLARAPHHPESTMAITWKERRIKALALGAEIELAERTKQLVAKADVRRAWGLQATKVTNAFKGLGRQIAPLLSHKGPQEIQALVDRRVLEILKELSHPK